MISRRGALRLGSLMAVAPVISACGRPDSGTDPASASASGDSIDRVANRGFAGRVLQRPLAKPTQIFTDTSGAPYDIGARTAGRLTLLFFGYTSCPDVCPVHLGIIAAALRRLSGPPSRAAVIFVGVDTRRDTPRRMRTFLDAFDRDFVGLTAAPSVIDSALADLELPATVIEPAAPDGGYSVGHASQVLVFGADDRCHIEYPFGTRTEDWVRDLQRITDADWTGR